MRLVSIKLAGFKSFVDPANILIQSNINAIVGPNGCGKSNVVDALRWVIGESSAKQLRGELLTDVIFNGSTNRKPVGQAAVELMFDNSEGRLGGAYSQYNEISIRREITREGQSQFYLNGTRCRRKDITDVFLGTGLGPSSYAIIEQGMVSRLIEGKPEEIRVFLEEAAGISKYRERRRETENRIKHTRENLERLTDVRAELDKQLAHLKRQANAAERFKLLKEEQRLFKAQLSTLRCKKLDEQLQATHQELEEGATALEGKIAEQRRIDRELEQSRQQLTEANETSNQVQARFYAAGAEMARQEQQIQHIQDQDRQITADIRQTEQLLENSNRHLTDDQQQQQKLQQEIATLKPEVELAFQEHQLFDEKLQQAQDQQNQWQTEWDVVQAEASKIEQKVQIERTRVNHLQQKLQSVDSRLQQLNQQRENLHQPELGAIIEQLSAQADQLKQQMEQLQQQTNEINQQLQDQKNQHQAVRGEYEQNRQQLQTLLKQQASLEALQQAALGKANQGIAKWLAEKGWDKHSRLLDCLQVEAGWEKAVETVLQPYLEAICLDSEQDWLLAAEQLTQGKAALFNTSGRVAAKTNHATLRPLLAKISSKLPIDNLLTGIYVAEDAQSAMAQAQQLQANESIVSKDGIWFGPNWMRINNIKDETSGVLERKQSLEDLQTQIEQQQQKVQAFEQSLQEAQQKQVKLEEQRDYLQRDFRGVSANFGDVRSQLSAKQAQFEQIQQRFANVERELEDYKNQQTQAQAQLQEATQAKVQAEEKLPEFQLRRNELQQQREKQNSAVRELRQKVQQQKQIADQLQVRLSTTQNKLDYLESAIQRSQQQLAQLQTRLTELKDRHSTVLEPLPELQQQLQTVVSQRSEIEKELTAARAQVNHIEHSQRQSEKERLQIEELAQKQREHLEKLRISQSTLQTHRENQLQLIQETGFVLETLINELPPEAEEGSWQEQLNQIETRIQRLGPINLAAIEEFTTLSERKDYLDAQDKDLNEALTTLEDAIRKIDRESRGRLKETFDRANENFQSLFGKMFEGGNAQLELTGEEVLDAGIVIRAQPPGKRNTLLHLLSGGEKALTAIALVFALFQLNPAPFCVLDEVDAPLDEANVGRFCRLVESMSATVQFLYISHNKVSMSMAKQLIGVTMHEPGVSRLVSVDIDQAMAMHQ